jgi:hypothetical protein
MIRALRAQVYTGFDLMKVSTLRALSPADGRYADKVEVLRDIFSEYGLIRFRVLVEVRWLQCLADEPTVAELEPLSNVMKDVLNSIVDDFSLDDAARVKEQRGARYWRLKCVSCVRSSRRWRLTTRQSLCWLGRTVRRPARRRWERNSRMSLSG